MSEYTLTSGDTLEDIVRDDGTEETVVTFTEGGTAKTVSSTSPPVAEAAQYIKSEGYLMDPDIEVFIEYEGETLTAIGYRQTVP